MKQLLIASMLMGSVLHAVAQDYRLLELTSEVKHVQPMTGLVLWPDEAEDRYEKYGQSHALEYSYVAPCKVVKSGTVGGEIVYDWGYLDDLLDDVKSRNHQAVIRFFYEYPGERMVDNNRGTSAVPAYIKAQPDYQETYKKVAGDGETWYADWSNNELKRFTKQFYTDFATRYANDPRIAFVEVGFGHWSEYHMYDDNGVDIQFDRNFPSKAYQKEFFMHLKDVMSCIPWSISIDASDTEYTPFTEDAELMALQFGVFDDSFMHQNHEIGSKEGYNEECWIAMGTDRWKSGVCGGEISYYKDADQKNFLNPAGMYGHTWEEQAAKYHITFMIANDAPGASVSKYPHNTPERFKEGSMATGYRFCVTECKTDGVNTLITLTNKGVAPLYHDAFFSIGGVRSVQTLKGLLPGEVLTVMVSAPLACDALGKATEVPVIVSDHILQTQVIEYDAATSTAIDILEKNGDYDDVTYSLSGVRVGDDYKGVVIRNGKKIVKN